MSTQAQITASQPVPTPAEVAPSWWRPSQKYVTPPEFIPRGSSPQQATFSPSEKREAICSALVQYGTMQKEQLAERVPELSGDPISTIAGLLRHLKTDGFVKEESKYTGSYTTEYYSAIR